MENLVEQNLLEEETHGPLNEKRYKPAKGAGDARVMIQTTARDHSASHSSRDQGGGAWNGYSDAGLPLHRNAWSVL